jgi:anti-anti-sigma regulatory factor
VEWEHLADDYIAQGVGLSALCAYALPTLAHGTLRDLAAVHPAASGPADESFRIYFDADRLVLAGSADSFSAELLERLLTASHRFRGGVVTIDVHALDFIDGRACAAIAGWADTLNMWSAQVRIAGASRIFRRVWQVLGFDTLANTSFAELAA